MWDFLNRFKSAAYVSNPDVTMRQALSINCGVWPSVTIQLATSRDNLGMSPIGTISSASKVPKLIRTATGFVIVVRMCSLLESSVGTDQLAAQIEIASSQLMTQQRQIEGFAQETST